MIMYCFHNNSPDHFTITKDLQMIDLKFAFRSMIDRSGFDRSDRSFSRIVWPLQCSVFILWELFTFQNMDFLPLSPPGWRGIVVMVRAGGRADGRLPNLRNPYLCNRLTDFLHSKFCGIVWACRCALSWPYAHLPHMGLPMGQKLVKFATNWVQTLRNAYLWNCWMDLPHLKFHGLV